MKSSGKPYALPLCVYTMKNHSVVSYSCRHGVIYRKTVIFVVNAVNSSDISLNLYQGRSVSSLGHRNLKRSNYNVECIRLEYHYTSTHSPNIPLYLAHLGTILKLLSL